MSAIDDIVDAIGGVIEKITETSQATNEALQQTDVAKETAAGLGAEGVVEGLGQVKQELETLITTLGGVSSSAEEIQATARAVGEST